LRSDPSITYRKQINKRKYTREEADELNEMYCLEWRFEKKKPFIYSLVIHEKS